LYEWNIDGLFEQELMNKMNHMSMVANAYITNQSLSHSEIVDLLTTGFSGTRWNWWDKHLTEDSREKIRKAIKKDEEGFPIFDEQIDTGEPDGVNTLIYTIIKLFVGTPSNITSRISDYLNSLRCPTMSDYRWYQYVFLSRVMVKANSQKPYWKEKFIDGLPSLFAYKVKDELLNSPIGLIEYDNLTYGDLFSTVKKLGIKMCIDQKMIRQQLKNAKKAKYEVDNFGEQFGLPHIAPSQKNRKKFDIVFRKKYASYYNNYKKIKFIKLVDKFSKKPKKKTFKFDKYFPKGKCFNCGKLGHFAYKCPNPPKKIKQEINALNIDDSENENIFRILQNNDFSYYSSNNEYLSSDDSDYHSASEFF
jgi:hypothetical protein